MAVNQVVPNATRATNDRYTRMYAKAATYRTSATPAGKVPLTVSTASTKTNPTCTTADQL